MHDCGKRQRRRLANLRVWFDWKYIFLYGVSCFCGIISSNVLKGMLVAYVCFYLVFSQRTVWYNTDLWIFWENLFWLILFPHMSFEVSDPSPWLFTRTFCPLPQSLAFFLPFSMEFDLAVISSLSQHLLKKLSLWTAQGKGARELWKTHGPHALFFTLV